MKDSLQARVLRTGARLQAAWRGNLKLRLGAGVIGTVLLTTLVLTTTALYFVKRSLQASIAQEQQLRLASIADSIDQKFASRRTLLKTFAHSVEAQSLPVGAIQDFLEAHSPLKDAFDNVSFLDDQGNLIANLKGREPLNRINLRDREYFQQTVSRKAGLISKPIRNRLNGLAQVVMTEPIMDANGHVRYVMSGAINLAERNFLGEVAGIRFGSTGYMFILNTDGIVVDHPRKDRILKPDGADGTQNKAATMALAGFEGTTEAMNRYGVYGLYSFKRIKETDWILGSIYPRDEAFAPIQRIETAAWAGACVLALLGGILSLVVIRKDLAPLRKLNDHMGSVTTRSPYVPVAAQFQPDEIGRLARTFDTLMAQRQLSRQQLVASEKFLRELTDNIPAVLAYFDTDLRIRFANAAASSIGGTHGTDVVGRTMEEVLPPHLYQQHRAPVQQVLQGRRAKFEGRLQSDQYFVANLVPDIGEAGGVEGFYELAFDVSAQKLAEAERAAGERKLQAITDHLPVIIYYIDAQQRYRFANRTSTEWTGRSRADVLGRTMEEVLSAKAYETRLPQIEQVLGGKEVEFEIDHVMPDGTKRINLSRYIPDMDADGRVLGFYALSVDITAAKQLERNLSEMAWHDTLTGLPNRRRFDLILDEALRRRARTGKAIALMFLDVDHFKQINDTLGHGAGDRVLIEFSGRLRAAVRETDTVARLGGDEFVVILEGLATTEEAQIVGRKVLAAFQMPFTVAEMPRLVYTSIGLVFCKATQCQAKELLAAADGALYAAKGKGRNMLVLEEVNEVQGPPSGQ